MGMVARLFILTVFSFLIFDRRNPLLQFDKTELLSRMSLLFLYLYCFGLIIDY